MSKVAFVLGAEADIASSEELDAGIGRIEGLLQPRGKDRSIRRIEADSTVMPAVGPALLNFGHAPANTLWVPLTILVTGGDDRTVVVGGQAAVYFGGEASFTPGLLSLLIPASTNTAIPYWQQIGGKDAIYGHYGDSLFVLVYGAPAGTNLMATARIREVSPAGIEEMNIL